MIERVCEYCGKGFEAWPSVVKKGVARFCSTKCGYASRKERNNKKREILLNCVCKRCSKEFKESKLIIDLRGGNFCSRNCQRRNTKYICNYCGKEFWGDAEKVKNKKGIFCSHDCYSKDLAVPLEQRFWKYVDKKGDDECWVWVGELDKKGYGRLKLSSEYNGRHPKATHIAWFLEYGEWPPKGKVVMHTCDQPGCVNKYHLRVGTQKENIQDCVNKGRHNHGCTHHNAKLVESDVVEIRQRLATGGTQRVIAHTYGVTKATIAAIAHNKTWKHVPL